MKTRGRKRKLRTEHGEDLSSKTVSMANNNESPQSDGFGNFGGFKLVKILSNSAAYKRIVLQVKYKDKDSAVVILDKKPFSEKVVEDILSAVSVSLHNIFQNNIHGSSDCYPTQLGSEIKTTIIYPCTQKHIDKYTGRKTKNKKTKKQRQMNQYIHHCHRVFLVEETATMYEEVTLPHLKETCFNIQWVFNILDHNKEADRIAYEDPDPVIGFILLPDLKWDGVALENLYLVAIVHAKGIKSLRDLTAKHIPLLENILEGGTTAIKEKYGVSRSELRVYLHYQPSYYHLHVHFTALQFNAPGIYPEKAHLLPTVIGNIKLNPAYYQKVTLPFLVKGNEALHTKLVEYGYTF